MTYEMVSCRREGGIGSEGEGGDTENDVRGGEQQVKKI